MEEEERESDSGRTEAKRKGAQRVRERHGAKVDEKKKQAQEKEQR